MQSEGRLLKILLSCLLILLAIVALSIIYWTIRYVESDPQNRHALSDPGTKELALICAVHKERSTQRTNGGTLSQSALSDEEIKEWLSSNVPQIMAMNHTDIQSHILKTEGFFTPNGWCDFIDALASSKLVDSAIARKLHIRIVLDSKPAIKNKTVSDKGVYTWFAEMPVEITFTADDPNTNPPDLTNQLLVIQLERSNAQSNPDGIGIAQWIMVSNGSKNSGP